ncbi:MFS transporter [Paraburkholderia sp. BL25I1N1]|uniref:MFS transporter n=1 Tax=Paraburkholderia sp. BL25I1N1 TaxID=1938804 RepID=UPI000D053AE8|nr:MFS transporter [Paraburkholderia sp. BL25I1N1]
MKTKTERVDPHVSAAIPRQSMRPYAAIGAVLLGTIISTFTSRLTSLGLADLRGALGISFDQGAWINTAFNAGQMFIGPIAVWAAFVTGVRRLLICGAVIFFISQMLLPFSPNFSTLIFIQVVSGLSSGVFVPVAIGVIVRTLPPRWLPFGIAAYAMNIEMSLNVSATLEGWYSEHFTWHWFYWQNAALTLPFIAFVALSIPTEPYPPSTLRGDHTGMLLGASGFVCLLVGLDQGERLFWFQSGFVTSILYAGALLIAAFLVWEFLAKSPGIALDYLVKPNIFLLLALTCLTRFALLNTSVIPSIFLGAAHNLRPLQIGETLHWIAIPQIFAAPFVAFLLLYVDARRVIIAGFAIVTVAFLLGADITPDWVEGNFIPSQLLQGIGQTMIVTSTVYFLAKHLSPEYALTFGALVQTTRLFGGQLGTTSIALAQRIREQMYSNDLVGHLNTFDPQSVERVLAQAGLFSPGPVSMLSAPLSVYALIDRAIRVQATTLALADNFRIAAAAGFASVLIALFLRRPPAKI